MKFQKGHPMYKGVEKGWFKKGHCQGLGIKKSEEHKRKLAFANLGKKRTQESIDKQFASRKGYRHSDETKRKIMESNKFPRKGGRVNHQGYIMIYHPKHPSGQKGNGIYILEHRLVMEKILGRPLKKDEIVHHKNSVRNDNRPENLVLVIRGKNWHPCICPKCGFDFLIK